MSSDHQQPNSDFESTRWSIVLEAGHHSSGQSKQALESLVNTYSYPLYAYIRRRGHSIHDAEDLIQGFFARLLEKDVLEAADPNRGRFRSFLLASLRNYLANERDKQSAKKRGGDRAPVSLDFAAADSRYSKQSIDELSPERLYEKQWAITLLDHVMERLREDLAESGKLKQFEVLRSFIAGRSEGRSYAEAAQKLDCTEEAAMAAASRLRKRYRALLRAEISQTLADSNDVEAEIAYLFEVLGS